MGLTMTIPAPKATLEIDELGVAHARVTGLVLPKDVRPVKQRVSELVAASGADAFVLHLEDALLFAPIEWPRNVADAGLATKKLPAALVVPEYALQDQHSKAVAAMRAGFLRKAFACAHAAHAWVLHQRRVLGKT